MLDISPAQIAAFEASGLRALAPRIDRWLEGIVPHWAALPPATRHAQLLQMIDHGRACGMDSEHDHALFAWICTRLGSGWRETLTAPDCWAVLTDPRWRAEPKLMWLEETLLRQQVRA